MGCKLSKQSKSKNAPKYRVLSSQKQTSPNLREAGNISYTESRLLNDQSLVPQNVPKIADKVPFTEPDKAFHEVGVTLKLPITVFPDDAAEKYTSNRVLILHPEPDHIIEPSSHDLHNERIKDGMFDADVLAALMDVEIAYNVRKDIEYRAILEQLE